MIALAAPPLITRPVRNSAATCNAELITCHPELVEGPPGSSSPVHDDVAEALAKVKTPADDEVAKQQQAFDRMMQLRTEQEREANAIREFGLAQQKKENDFMEEMIRMI
jgi:hypothetical protein